MGNRIHVAVFGAGRIGRIHIENLLKMPDVVVEYVVDVRLEETKRWANNLNVKCVTSDISLPLKDKKVDAIVICSPSDTHADLITEAARAGKDIFCEKPIDKELNKIKQSLKVVRETGVKLQVGFNRRFDHNFKKIKGLIERGELGEIHVVNITSRDPEPPSIEYVKSSGGIFLDMTIHDFDMARYLVNDEVDEVFAIGSVLIDPRIGEEGDYDTAAITMKFRNGAIAMIDNSRKAVYGYDQRVEAFGSKGSALAYNDRPTNVVVSTAQDVCMDKPLYFFLERYKESFEMEIREFIDCLNEDKVPPVTGEDGLNAMLIAMAATRSAKEGRPVKVKEVME